MHFWLTVQYIARHFPGLFITNSHALSCTLLREDLQLQLRIWVSWSHYILQKKLWKVPITVCSYRLMFSSTHVWQILFGYQVPNQASHFLCKSQPQQCFSAPVPSLHAYRAAFLHQTHKSSRVQKRGGQVGPELPLFSHTAELFILSSVILSQPTHTLLSFVRGSGDSRSLCLFLTVMDW